VRDGGQQKHATHPTENVKRFMCPYLSNEIHDFQSTSANTSLNSFRVNNDSQSDEKGRIVKRFMRTYKQFSNPLAATLAFDYSTIL